MRLEVPKSESDPRVRRYVQPARVVWASGAAANADKLLEPKTGLAVLDYDGDEAPAFVLDFGRELHGGVAIRNGPTQSQKPVRVRIRFGESVSEAMSEPNNEHAIHDQTCLIPWYGTHETGNTGFRFVRIDMLDKGSRLELEHVLAVFVYQDLDYLGSFECNDERLNTIWQTGAYTVHLCMQDMLWDGIKRDRLVWIGDSHPESMVISTVFGDADVVRKSLDFVRDDTPLPKWMNGISSYSLWWVIDHHDWYLYHGDLDYLKEQRDYLIPLLAMLCEQVGEDGAERMGDSRFLDWPSSEDPEAIHAGLQALLLMTLERAVTLCDLLGELEQKNACQQAADKLRTHTPAPTPCKQANALLALSGLAEVNGVNELVLAVDQMHGLSTFYGYYVLQARAQAGDYTKCLEVIRQYWGAMLDLGATTFWEDFHLSWTDNAAGIDELVPEGKKDIHADFGDYCYKGLRHSLCHGWAAGPTAWLSEHVLGFRPLAPGCARLLVDPHLGDLEYARGTFPTPHGVVEVSHRRTPDGATVTEVNAPEGIEVVRA